MTNFIYHLYVKSKRMIQISLLTKPKQTHRHRKETWLSKGEGYITSMGLTDTHYYI